MMTSRSKKEPALAVILVDSREKIPLSFDPAHAVTVRRALVAGDYSLDGHETSVAVERKSLDDFVGSVVRGRERFLAELRRLEGYELACIVVEGSLEDVLAHRYRAGVHPNAVFGAALSIIVDHGIPIYFCGDRQIACAFVEGLLCRYHRKIADSALPASQT
jgi:ERCC4-type nuclease